MNTHDRDRIKQLLRISLPPVDCSAEPSRDLWPAVLRRLHADLAAPASASFSAPWFDLALLAGLAIFAISFPATIPVFLYYL